MYSCPIYVYRIEVLKYQQTEKQERILLHGEHTEIACPALVPYVTNTFNPHFVDYHPLTNSFSARNYLSNVTYNQALRA